MTTTRPLSLPLMSFALLVAVGSTASAANRSDSGSVHRIALDRVADLTLVRCRAEVVNYRGKGALRLLYSAGQETADTSMIAVLTGTDFKDGTISLDVAGAPRPDAPGSRGFIGLAFHVTPGAERYECFYLRPTNARAEDKLRRNHTVQYVSSPDFPWQRLRQESPGMYESYADMEPGVWTHLEVRVAGTQARLFVNGASQPALIVNDLKLGEASGAIALWSYTFTDGYFANLSVK